MISGAAGLTQGLEMVGAAGPDEYNPPNLPFVGSLQHHWNLLPGATLLPSSPLQGMAPALWLPATERLWFLNSRDGMVGPCWLTLIDTAGDSICGNTGLIC